MMKQVALLSSNPTNITHQKLEFSKNMTIKGKKNSKVKIVTNKRRHNYWGNIFRRKRIMSEYFSDSAFGSQSDTKIELYNPWEDDKLMQKYRSKKILEYEYDENEIMPTNLSFVHDPNTYHNNNKEQTD